MKTGFPLLPLMLAATIAAAQVPDTIWVRMHQVGAQCHGRAVAALGTELCVAGTATQASDDVFVVRYTASGDSVWTRTVGFSSMEATCDVGFAGDSSVVVAAAVQGATPATAIVKFNHRGDTVWTRLLDRLDPANIAVDAAGATFVWGSGFGSMPDESLSLAKVGSDGQLQWRRGWDLGDRHRAAGCTFDGGGRLVVAAVVNDQAGTHGVIWKLTANGDTVWTRMPPELNGIEMRGVAADAASIYVAGLQGPSPRLFRLTGSGQMTWMRPLNGSAPTDAVNTVAVDASGNCVAVFTDPAQFLSMLKLSPDGAELWNDRYELEPAAPYAVAVDAEQRPVVTGLTTSGPQFCLTVKFTGAPAALESRPEETGAAPHSPAPALARGRLTFDAPSTGTYRLTVLDSSGRLVRVVHDGTLTQGRHTLPAAELAAGTYTLRVDGPGGTSAPRVVNVR